MAAELLEPVDAAIIALDAGNSEVARAKLHALAEAVRGHGCGDSVNARRPAEAVAVFEANGRC